MRKMKKPYQKALAIPCFLFCDRLVKKETVSGMSGKMHGNRSDKTPAPKPMKNIFQTVCDVASSSPQPTTGFVMSIERILILVEACTPPSSATEKVKGVEG